MRKKELKLTDIPGDYLSKEDFYKIAHISKRTALWLIETELVLAERPEKQGYQKQKSSDTSRIRA